MVSNGSPMIVGSSGLVTVMTCRQVDWFPHASTVVHVLLIKYPCVAGTSMVTSLCVMEGAMSHKSVEVASPVLTGVVSSIHSIVTFAGQVMNGGRLSSMVIICVHVLEFPHTSVDVHVLVMVYSSGQEGDSVVTSL